jgi:hypothetical protein
MQTPTLASESKTSYYRKRLASLTDDQSSWRPHWKEISEYMLPRQGRYLDGSTDTRANDGKKVHSKIINGSAKDALRIIAAGMQGGLTSPSRPWFQLKLADRGLMEYQPVREWMHYVRDAMMTHLSRSNFYGAIHGGYQELAAFGTWASLQEEDFKTLTRFRPFTIGEYKIGLDSMYRPDSLYRQFALTARQLVEAYGYENCSVSAQTAFKNGDSATRFEVVHIIEPNRYKIEGAQNKSGMDYISVHFELAADPDKVLKESGYRKIPFVAPRWEVTGVDTYGGCPGMDALGDCKMLQKMEEKKLKGLDKSIEPPMNASPSLKKTGGTIVSGGVNYIDMNAGENFTPAYLINPNMQNIAFEIDRVEARIRRFFFNDLFLSIITQDKQMTATEVAKRHEEKLMMLGPVLERLQSEMLNPIVERTFDIMQSFNALPPIPKEIQGMDIEVEYISLLAQAQKMVGTASVEQTAAFVGNLAAVNPEVLDKVDFDEAVDQYAEMVGAPPTMIRSDDVVAKLREQKAQAAAQAQAQANMAAMVQGAKVLSDTKLGQNSALDALTGAPRV